jgi:hypothetical protein
MRRGGAFKWPPAPTEYNWESLQGIVVQAEILHRAGYPAWEYGDRAVCRAVAFLFAINDLPDGDDVWLLPVVNRGCGTGYTVTGLGTPGKGLAYTFWTHQ